MFLKRYLQIVYAFWARIYDSFIDERWYFDRERVIEKLKIKKNGKILEIGVGTGLNLPFYPFNCTVFGIDFSEAMLEKAMQKRIKSKVILEKMDANKLKFPDNFFDKVLMTYVLRVAPNPNKVLDEIARVLKSKGKLVIVDQFKKKDSSLLNIIQPIRILMGSGRDYFFEELIKGKPFVIKKRENFGTRQKTELILLERN